MENIIIGFMIILAFMSSLTTFAFVEMVREATKRYKEEEAIESYPTE